MRRRPRRGATLIEAIAATVIAASMLVPLVGMLKSGAMVEQRCRIRDRMVDHAQGLLDKIRIGTATPAAFNSATYGTMPPGVTNNQVVTILPGERARFSISMAPIDGQRDIILVTVTGMHISSGTGTVSPVMLLTGIARPW